MFKAENRNGVCILICLAGMYLSVVGIPLLPLIAEIYNIQCGIFQMMIPVTTLVISYVGLMLLVQSEKNKTYDKLMQFSCAYPREYAEFINKLDA